MPRDAHMVGTGLASGRVALSPTEAIALDYTLRQELKAPKAEGSHHDSSDVLSRASASLPCPGECQALD